MIFYASTTIKAQRVKTGAAILPDQLAGEDDAMLMRKVARGDRRAFEVLLVRHLPATARMAARVMGSTADADDIAQEAFIRVWKHAPQWEAPERAGAQFTTWLYRVVLNLCIDHKRQRRFTTVDEFPEQIDMRANAEENMQRREQSARVKKVIMSLPERQKQAFVLCFYEEISNKEAARIIGVSVKALESLLVRARRTLHKKLAGEK